MSDDALGRSIPALLGLSEHPFELDPPGFRVGEGEEPVRPQEVRRLRFEHHWTRELYRLAPHVVPIEHVRAGDRQVAVLARGLQFPDPTVIDLDVLAGYPAVESVAGFAQVRLRTPLPHVRELMATPHDDETLDHLPNLEVLAPGRRRSGPIDARRVPETLRDLAGVPFAAKEDVLRLRGLRRWMAGGLHDRSAEMLAPLRELRWLHADFGKGLRHLGGLEQLEMLSLDVQEGPSLPNLKALRRLERLRYLHVTGRRLSSLEGIEALPALEALFLYRPGVTDLACLAGHPRLSHVRLDGPDRVTDFSPLRELPALEWLHVEFHSHSELPVPDLPGVEVRWWKPWPEPEPDARVGPIALRRLDDGSWSIFQDVCDLLGVASNHEAEDRLRAQVRQVDPALHARLDFDSEGDALAVSGSADDVRAAAAILRSLAGD